MNLEELMEQHLALQETLKAKQAEIDTLNVFKTEFETKEQGFQTEISRLKETNMSLFLKVSQQSTEVEPEPQEQVVQEKEKPVSWDSFMSNW